MKVAKPDWINHNGMPICSIDIHPDGSRLATGGQGVDSGRIVIWNMAPIISEEKEMDENVPRMLCQLDNHLACVNCVRWSSSGKFLASGGDDKLVMVWTISKASGGNSVFGGKGKVNIEAWRCVFTLRSHEGDVLDIAWSPSDRWIATCSIDNTVIVWAADNLPEIASVLRGHTGLVKGVSWDPVGKYLSSQSDDRTVRIWRTTDWKQEAMITTPFEKCSGTTLVLRLSWSPDGQYLVTAHAMNGAVPTAQIIERDGWAHDKDFVGHHMAITCVRFSSRIMEFGRGRACALALGSRDRSVSVWSTSLVRPLVVLEELFSSPVGDLAWDPTGQALMAVSTDGTAALLHFTQEEIGAPITESDKSTLFEKLYGKVGTETGTAVVVENPEVLVGPPPTAAPAPPPLAKQGSQHTPPMARHQIETKTKDGRRRITPIYIPPAHDSNEEVVPFGSDSTSFSSSCIGAKSRIVVERRDELSESNKISTPSAESQQQQPQPPPVTPPKAPTAPVHSTPLKPVTPTPAVIPPSTPREDGGYSLLLGWTEKGEIKRKRGAGACVAVEAPGAKHKRDSHHHILPPLALTAATTTIKMSGGRGVLEVENRAVRSQQGKICAVRCYAVQGDQTPAWELMIGCDVVGCVGGTSVVAVAGCDGAVRVVSSTDGAPLLPPLALSAPASLLKLSAKHLLLLSTDARLSSWALGPPLTPAIPDLSIVPTLHSPDGGNVRIKECLISDAGEPMLALSSGRAYAYSIQHNTWLLVGDSSDPVGRHVLQSFRSPPPGPPLPLKTIQNAASNGSTGKVEVSQVSRPCTLSYLEAQVSCAKALNSPHEYKFWLLALVRFLLQQGMERRVRCICEGLLGPAHSTRQASTWQPQILGLEKQALLKEVLSEISIHLPSQRLYLEFSDQLNTH